MNTADGVARRLRTIWFPHTTVVGWAPYAMVLGLDRALGLTWVDDEPWGFGLFTMAL